MTSSFHNGNVIDINTYRKEGNSRAENARRELRAFEETGYAVDDLIEDAVAFIESGDMLRAHNALRRDAEMLKSQKRHPSRFGSDSLDIDARLRLNERISSFG